MDLFSLHLCRNDGKNLEREQTGMEKVAGKRVVHMTSVHSATDGRIFLKECRTLAQAGYDVRIIAPGEVEEMVDGVLLIPHPQPRNRLNRFTKTLRNIFVAAVRQRADVYHFHDPELMLVGLALKLMGKRVIYDVHESYRDAILDKGWVPAPMRWLLAKATGLFEGAATQVFDAVVAATPHIAEMFPARKTFVVFNYPQFEEFTNPGSLPLADRAPDFTYIGGIARVRGIEEMVAAFAETADPRIHFRLAGPFLEPGLEAALVALPGWSRVRYHGWLSRKQIADLCDEVLAGLVVLQPIKRYMHSLPIKLFEYMSAGLPVIASDFPLWRKIIERHRCGILVNPTNPRDIAKAMDWVVTHRQEAAEMGARGRQAVLTEFNWGYATGQLLACYKQVLA